MSADMKDTIARTAIRLLLEKREKKLTVTNLVEACQITRQTFYYHFADIPALFRWILEKGIERLTREFQASEDPEQGLRSFFLVAQSMAPLVQKGMQSSYRDELEQLLAQLEQACQGQEAMAQNIYRLFDNIVEQENLYQSCTRAELQLVLRYHSQAILGLLRQWSPRDQDNLDLIVHTVYRLMIGNLSPHLPAAVSSAACSPG